MWFSYRSDKDAQKSGRASANSGQLSLEAWGVGGSDLEAGDHPGMLKVSQCGHQVTACRREALEVCDDCTLLAFPGGPTLLQGTLVPSSDILPEVRRWEKQKRDAQREFCTDPQKTGSSMQSY